MAFALLTAEALHLQGMGLRFVLMPEPTPQSPAAAPQARASTPARGTAPASGTAPRQQWQTRQADNRPRPAQRPVQSAPRPAPQTPARSAHQAASARPQQPATSCSAAPALWPAPWSALLGRTRPGRVAWTYHGLGHDLCGTPNSLRRRRLQELIRFLSLPAGTHTFWPVGLPEPDEDGKPVIVPRPELFWDGLHRLDSRVLIVLGSPAARCIGITGPIRPMFSPMQAFNGVRLLITWDIDSLDDEQKMNGTRTFLRAMLSRLA